MVAQLLLLDVSTELGRHAALIALIPGCILLIWTSHRHRATKPLLRAIMSASWKDEPARKQTTDRSVLVHAEAACGPSAAWYRDSIAT